MTVQIGRGAYFKTEPSVLTIPAGDSLPVKVVYQPNNMGAHSDMLRVRLFDRERELKCAEEPPRIRAEGTALVAATLRSTVSQGSGMSGGLRGDAERTAGGKGELAATQRSRKPATAPPSSSRKPMLEKPEARPLFNPSFHFHSPCCHLRPPATSTDCTDICAVFYCFFCRSWRCSRPSRWTLG